MSDATLKALAKIRRMPTSKLRALESAARDLRNSPLLPDAAVYLARRTRNDENAMGRAIDAAEKLAVHVRAEMIRRGCTF